ncbi:MAG: TetR/AcrR family transcriptional regulator [Peptococcaceae bacterium]|nr:TetR/AcrR family transcriptional regulator [Peptococcaceae bacterium]
MPKHILNEEAIINAGKTFIAKEGFGALSMRGFSESMGVAVGSVYNYFPSKGALMRAIIASIWEEILAPLRNLDTCTSFAEAVACLVAVLREGEETYPGILALHADQLPGKERSKGRAEMNARFDALKAHMLTLLAADARVRPGVFGDGLTPEAFIDDILTLAIVHQAQDKASDHALRKLVENAIY